MVIGHLFWCQHGESITHTSDWALIGDSELPPLLANLLSEHQFVDVASEHGTGGKN